MRRIFGASQKWLSAGPGMEFRPQLPSYQFLIGCGLAVAILTLAGTGQQPPAPAQSSQKPQNTARSQPVTAPAAAPEVAVPAEQTPAPAPLTPEEMPASAPQVTYEDGQLTIIAENSTLPDILAAVQRLTGALIAVPESASRERMAARLGPGPTREVLSSLLRWTDFNFIIQASDSDPQQIQSVLLMPRGKNAPGVGRGNPGTSVARLPGRPNRRFAQSNPGIAEAPEPENPPSVQPATAEAAASPEPTPAGPQPQPVDVQSAATSTPAAPVDPQPVAADLTPAPVTPQADSNRPPATRSQQMMEELQRMYEQRRQLQQQERKPTAAN